MATDERNKSKAQPKVDWVKGAEGDVVPKDNFYPVVYKFPVDQPIYWGPGQNTIYVEDGGPEGYVEPAADSFDSLQPLTIPVVIRGIVGHNSAYTPDDDPPPDPGNGHQCSPDSGVILLGYQQGMDGGFLHGTLSPTGTVIPYYYPEGYPCGTEFSGSGSSYSYYKAAVILNELSDNYETDITTTQLLSTFTIPEAHNKLAIHGYISKSRAGVLLAASMGTVNISGPGGDYSGPTGCASYSLVQVIPGGVDPGLYRTLPIPNLPWNPYTINDDEIPKVGNGGEKFTYFQDSFGYTAKFTIFYFVDCAYLRHSPFAQPFGVLFRGWFSAPPADGPTAGGYDQIPQPPRILLDHLVIDDPDA